MKSLSVILLVLLSLCGSLYSQGDWSLFRDPDISQTDFSKTYSFSESNWTIFNNFGTSGPFPTSQEGTLAIGWADTLSALSKVSSTWSAYFRMKSQSSLWSVEVRVGLANNKGFWVWFGKADKLFPGDTSFRPFSWDVSWGSQFVSLDSVYVLAISFQIRTDTP